MKRIAAAALLALALPFLFIACGGETSPEDNVQETVDQILDAKEPEELETACGDLVTTRFVEEVYGGDQAKCTEEPVNSEEGIEDPGEMSADSIEVDGTDATVKIVTEGGDTDGIDGTWEMVEEDGQWKLDRYGDDLLRTTFLVSIENVDEGLLGYEPMRKCMSRQVDDLDSATLRRFLFQTVQDKKPQALKTAVDIAKGCPRQLSEFVADTLAREVVAKEGASPAVVDCTRKEMATYLQLTGLAPNALRGGNEFGSATPAALAGIVSGALRTCQKG